MATDTPNDDKAPYYSEGILKLLGSDASTTNTPAAAAASLHASMAEDQEKRRLGCNHLRPVELRGVCIETRLGSCDTGTTRLKIIAAQNAPVGTYIELDDHIRVLTLDGAAVERSTFDNHCIDGHLPDGTRLYAKRLVAYGIGEYFNGSPRISWRIVVGKFMTIDQVSKIEDWTNLP